MSPGRTVENVWTGLLLISTWSWKKADCFQSVSLPYPVSFGIQIIILLVCLSVIDDFAVDVGGIGTDTVIKIFAYFVVP